MSGSTAQWIAAALLFSISYRVVRVGMPHPLK